MDENNREHFRITPESLAVKLAGKEVTLLNISLGGAKFKLKTDCEVKTHALVLLLDPSNALEVLFSEKECKGGIYRVSFIKMNAHVESTLSKYIMNWQSKRAFLSEKDE